MAELISVLGRPTATKTTSSSMLPDWTKLPKELLDVILSEKLDNCFDVVHARSVCSKWRSSFPFPSCLVRPSYPLPTFPIEKVGLWNLEKVPLFLFRSRAATSEFFVGGVGKDDHVDYINRLSPLQCSVKIQIAKPTLGNMLGFPIVPLGHQYRMICCSPEGVGIDDPVDYIDLPPPLHCSVKIQASKPTLRNMLDFQIVTLGHQYRMICWSPEGEKTAKRIVAFLPLSSDGGGEEFVVLCSYGKQLLVLRSGERKWVRIENVPDSECTGLVTFRGRFYATFSNEDVFVIDPYSLKATREMPTMPRLNVDNYLVQCGNDELFMVEKSDPDDSELELRVSKLDEKTGRWVVVSDLGDRVLLIGDLLNVCFLAKELPDGCGVSGNSILFTGEQSWLIGYKPVYFYKYDQNCWELASENLVTIDLDTYPYLSFNVEC